MKQTKPFGRPSIYEDHVKSTSIANEVTLPSEIHSNSRTNLEEGRINSMSQTGSAGGIFLGKRQIVGKSVEHTVLCKGGRRKERAAVTRFFTWMMILLPVFFIGFVLVRDSFLVLKNISSSPTDGSVMACSSGYISYPLDSIADLVLGNGRFVCTNWKTHHRHTVLPNGVNFVK